MRLSALSASPQPQPQPHSRATCRFIAGSSSRRSPILTADVLRSQDPFSRTLLLRFILCEAAFRLQKQTAKLVFERKLLPPRCEPPLPTAVSNAPAVLRLVRQLAASFGAVDEFNPQMPLVVVSAAC